jgi:MFS family permease
MNAGSELSSSTGGTTRGQWMTLLAAFLGWMFDGFEMGLFPLVGKPALRTLLATTDEKLVEPWFGMMIAVFLVGAATGGVLFGWLGDRIGRVRAMTLSVFTYAVFMGLCGIARSVDEMFVYRFISSLGMGGEWSLGVALVMEIWPNKSRGLLAGLIGAAANVGFLLIALIGLGLGLGVVTEALAQFLTGIGLSQEMVAELTGNGGWRILMIVGAVPAVLTFLIRLYVPESERWLHENSQGTTMHWATRDLLTVLVGALGSLGIIYLWRPNSDLTLPVRVGGSVLGLCLAIAGYMFPVIRFIRRAELASGSNRGEWLPVAGRMLIGACLSGVALLGTWGSIQWAPSWADQLVERQSQTEGWEESITRDARTKARAFTQIGSGIGAIVGTMAGALIGSTIGRRPTYLLLCLASLGSALLFFRTNTVFGPWFLVTVFFAGGLTASFYGWLPLYLPELFATRVRATGQGFSFNFGRILAAVGTLQTGHLMALFGGSYPQACTIMSLVYLVGAVIIWAAPETHGHPLPE